MALGLPFCIAKAATTNIPIQNITKSNKNIKSLQERLCCGPTMAGS